MSRDGLAKEHEDGLAVFISREWRDRFQQSLASPQRREKVLARLNHFRHLEMRFASPVPMSDQKSAVIGVVLRRHSAPGLCYVVSDDSDFDGREMALAEALVEIVDGGISAGTFISCIPGRLAYFHDEEPTNRYVLRRDR
jgi:hypothetical protein